MGPETTDRLAVATRNLSAAHDQPTRVLADTDELIEACDRDEAAAVALRARALARRRNGDLAGAIDDLRRAIQVATRRRLGRRVGEARMSLVVVLADAGRTREALLEADRARDLLEGADLSRLLTQRGLVLQRLGRYDEALSCYRQALRSIRSRGDVLWEAILLSNRGPLRSYLGDHRGAVADLRLCADLAEQQGLGVIRVRARQNLGFTMALVGDLPAALALLDEAEQDRLKLGADCVPVWVDRAEALLGAGLGEEAAGYAADALASLAERGLAYDTAEARLLLARASLQAGRPAAARHAAELATDEFRRQRRHTWARLARQVAVLARWDSGDCGPALTRAARRAADECAAAGWTVAAQDSRFVAARSALASGSRALALRLLGEVASTRRRGNVAVRVTAWHAEALLRLTEGDRPGAERALRRGLALHSENAAVLGATDLRAHAAVFGEELAALGVRLALEDGRARSVLSWVERSRATALHSLPARPPQDGRLAADLARLRAVAALIRDEAVAGRDVGALHRQQETLEQSVRDLARHARGSEVGKESLDIRTLAAALGSWALVELVRDRDDLHAVTLVDGRVTLHRLGGYAEAAKETEALRFALTRLAHPSTSERVRDLARRGRDVAAARLDDLVLTPLRSRLGGRPVVVVPTGDLHALPWPTLPTLRGRPVVVAPSARLWLRAAQAPRRRSQRAALVAGPRLDHAEAEVQALAGCYPGGTVLVGTAATADAVRVAVDGARLAHIATHGHFRSDNPQFSCLELADGPLTVYDLERMRRAPEVLVLSACDSGLSDVKPGDELMGLAASVMALGTRTLVASVVPVPDEPTRPFMEQLHARMRAGAGPAAALAATTEATGLDGFVCLGAG